MLYKNSLITIKLYHAIWRDRGKLEARKRLEAKYTICMYDAVETINRAFIF